MKDLLIIAGPTAVGKTEISLELAERLNGEIVSADSMQIYKYMDIGSAKISQSETRGIKHHMIDIIEPSREFSVAEYKIMAEECINNIINRGKLPILVGGTGLYINSIICNYNFSNVDRDEDYRKYLQQLAYEKGKDYVHSLLKDVDEESYNRLFPNDLKRVIRALEVYKLTGKPINYNDASEDAIYDIPYNIFYYVLTMDRVELYSRINKRVDIMLKNGLIEEVIKLREMGYNAEMQSMKGIGYKEILYYMDNKIDLDTAIEMIKQGSRNYAKRQLTWFRKDKRVIWIDKDKYENDHIIIEQIINNMKKSIIL